MALSNNIGQYEDVAIVLAKALEHGGGRYRLESERAAIRWRHRAYKYRSLLLAQKREELRGFPGIQPTTPYDSLILRVEGNTVEISVNRPVGSFEAPDGTIVDLSGEVENEREQAELEEARRLKEELGIE